MFFYSNLWILCPNFLAPFQASFLFLFRLSRQPDVIISIEISKMDPKEIHNSWQFKIANANSRQNIRKPVGMDPNEINEITNADSRQNIRKPVGLLDPNEINEIVNADSRQNIRMSICSLEPNEPNQGKFKDFSNAISRQNVRKLTCKIKNGFCGLNLAFIDKVIIIFAI